MSSAYTVDLRRVGETPHAQPTGLWREFHSSPQHFFEKMARMEHERSVADRIGASWTFGKERDSARTTHPLMVSWQELSERRPGKGLGLSRIARMAGLVLSLAVSPVTAITDPWLAERRRRDAAITVSIYREAIGRFISRAEALRIAREILEDAERERLAIAELEAARGVQWGDE